MATPLPQHLERRQALLSVCALGGIIAGTAFLFAEPGFYERRGREIFLDELDLSLFSAFSYAGVVWALASGFAVEANKHLNLCIRIKKAARYVVLGIGFALFVSVFFANTTGSMG